MVTCYEGAVNKRPVVIEGPTGLGKTKALLSVACRVSNHPSFCPGVVRYPHYAPAANIDGDLEELDKKAY